MFMPGIFTNSANATPDQIAQKRAMLMAMMPKFGSANYVGEGLGQLATGIAYGRQFRGMDKQEAAGRQSAADRFKALLGGGAAQPGAFNVLGQPPVDPMSPEAIGADTMAALGKGPLTQDQIVKGLVERGMPEHAALGFAMNFKDESGFDPAAVGDNGNAFGLGQWNGPRKKALFDFAAGQGKDPADPQVQYDYLMTELQGPESAAWAKIAGTNDPSSAAVAVLNHFERPAETHRARREAAYVGGQQPAGTQGSQIGLDQLYAAMADPWMGPEQKAILQSMIADRQKQTDPAYQLGLQKAQLEVDALRNKPAAEKYRTLTPEEAAQAGLPPGGVYQTDSSGKLYVTQKAPGQDGGVEYGLQPVYGTDENGNTVVMQLGKNGTAVATQLPDGVKPDLAVKGYENAYGTGRGKADAENDASASADMQAAKNALKLIGDLKSDPNRQRGTGWSSWFNGIPATAGYDYQNKVEQAKSGAFLTAIQSLRGLGALSNAEGDAATKAITRLDTATSEEAFLSALSDYEAIVQQGYDRAAQRASGRSGGVSSQPTHRFNPATGKIEIIGGGQ